MSNTDAILNNILTLLKQGVGIRGKSGTGTVQISADGQNRLNVNTQVSIDEANSSILVYGKNGTNNIPVAVDNTGKVKTVDSVGNSYLQSIDDKLNSAGNKLQVQDTALHIDNLTLINKLNQIYTLLSATGIDTSDNDTHTKLDTINTTLTNSVGNMNFDSNSNLQVINKAGVNIGSYGNVLQGNLIAGDSSPAITITNYRSTVISYTDTSYTLNNTIQLRASVDGTNYDFVGMLIPVTDPDTNERYATTVIDLSPFTYFKIINRSANAVNGITCSIYSNY
jgi:hypothetical protein